LQGGDPSFAAAFVGMNGVLLFLGGALLGFVTAWAYNRLRDAEVATAFIVLLLSLIFCFIIYIFIMDAASNLNIPLLGFLLASLLYVAFQRST
jgi:uncharacterized membrane protein